MKTTAAALAALLLFAGCGEKKEEQQSKTPVVQTAATGGIEVSKNENAYETKVAQKGRDANQSKSYYYDYNAEDTKVGDGQRSALDANLHVRSPYEQVEIELMVQKLSKEFIVKCSACHNDYANGIIGPSLLEKDAAFIYGTISKYKSGEKQNVLMNALVKQMSDDAIRKLADEISVFNEKVRELRAQRGMK